MKKLIFGIFAHPDDEAFLPSGSFLKWVEHGAELHLICATRGEKGQNPDHMSDLGMTREAEWRAAGKLLGARTQTQLGYKDGELSNHLFHSIANDVSQAIMSILNKHGQSAAIDFVTYEECGITGHLDHIAMSYVTTYVFTKLGPDLDKAHHKSRLLYACACRAISPDADTSFVYMPKGHKHSEIDITEDVTSQLSKKQQVMLAHHSQRRDAKHIIDQLGTNLAYEHFRLLKLT